MIILDGKYSIKAIKKNLPRIIIFVCLSLMIYGGIIYIYFFGEKGIYRIDSVFHTRSFITHVRIVNENSGEDYEVFLFSLLINLRANERVAVSEIFGIRIIQKTISSVLLFTTLFLFVMYILLSSKIRMDSLSGFVPPREGNRSRGGA